MKRILGRLSYANVMSTLAVFLVLGGATAFAATQLAKNSVGAKQLKKNAVTSSKLKKNAVTAAKIKKAAVTAAKLAGGAVGSAQLANGSVTGEKIDPASAPFTRLVGTVSQTAAQPWGSSVAYPIGSYTQPVGEDDVYVPGADVSFAASCNAPRTAIALVLIDAANPLAPGPTNYAGYIFIEDNGVGAVTRRGSSAPFPGGFGALTQASPLAPTTHKFDLLLAGSTCSSGSGVNIVGASVQVMGTKVG